MASAKEENITNLLTDNVLKTQFDGIDHVTVENTKNRLLDVVGGAIGGIRCPGNEELFELFGGWGGKEEATVMGYGVKRPAHEVAMLNCIFGRSFDRGPLTLIVDGLRFPSHITETTAFVALALGEEKGITGKELIASMVAGDDLAARLHIAVDRSQPGHAPLAGTPATRGQTDIFGAAAIAGRILGLNSAEIKNAFGLGMMFLGGGDWHERRSATVSAEPQSTPWLGTKDPFFREQMAKGAYEENARVKLIQGVTARGAINAAQLAKAGWVGLKNPFFNRRGGYYPGVESCNHSERVIEGLGKKYHVEQVFKPYPGGRPTHAPIDAALAIVKKHEIKANNIVEVTLRLSPPAAQVHYAKPYVVGDYPTMNALWSFYYAVANALLRREAKDEHYVKESILDQEVQRLTRKIKLDDLDKPKGIELEVRMKDGQIFSEYVPVALGEPSNPMSRKAMIGKFMEQVEFSGRIREGNAEKFISLVDHIEDVKDIRVLFDLVGRSNG